MSELLKNRYHYESIHELALRVKAVYPSFLEEDFVKSVMNGAWESVRAESPYATNLCEFGQIPAGRL